MIKQGILRRVIQSSLLYGHHWTINSLIKLIFKVNLSQERVRWSQIRRLLQWYRLKLFPWRQNERNQSGIIYNTLSICITWYLKYKSNSYYRNIPRVFSFQWTPVTEVACPSLMCIYTSVMYGPWSQVFFFKFFIPIWFTAAFQVPRRIQST